MPAHATINNSSVFLASPAELFSPRLAHLFPGVANAYRDGSDTDFCSKKPLYSLVKKLDILDFFFYNTS